MNMSGKNKEVIYIPLHFMESRAKMNRSTASLQIQKLFRGFLVRKSAKKVLVIEAQVDEIEKRISEKGTVELMRNEPKERFKVNEMLMNLLLGLDSVRGVRDLRKAVIRKVIVLQERIDRIVGGEEVVVEGVNGGEEKDETLMRVDSGSDSEVFEIRALEAAMDISDSGVERGLNEEGGIENLECGGGNGDKECGEKIAEETMDRIIEANEKLIEKNEKMMSLVMEMCEKNVVQMQLVSSLSQRVEKLERAYKTDRMRLRKKRQAAAGREKMECGRNS